MRAEGGARQERRPEPGDERLHLGVGVEVVRHGVQRVRPVGHAAVRHLQVEDADARPVLAHLGDERAGGGLHDLAGLLVHVGRQHHADLRVRLGDQHVLRQPELRHQHDEVGAVRPQRRDVAGHLRRVPGELDALGDPRAERVDGALAGQAHEADPDAVDRQHAGGRQEQVAGALVVDVGRERPPPMGGRRRPGPAGGAAGAGTEQVEEAVLAVEVVPVPGSEDVDPQPVDHVDERLAAGEQRLGAAVDGVAGVDQDAVRALGAEASDERRQPRQAALESAGGVAAELGAGHEVAVQVAEVDEPGAGAWGSSPVG